MDKWTCEGPSSSSRLQPHGTHGNGRDHFNTAKHQWIFPEHAAACAADAAKQVGHGAELHRSRCGQSRAMSAACSRNGYISASFHTTAAAAMRLSLIEAQAVRQSAGWQQRLRPGAPAQRRRTMRCAGRPASMPLMCRTAASSCLGAEAPQSADWLCTGRLLMAAAVCRAARQYKAASALPYAHRLPDVPASRDAGRTQ